MKATSWTVGIAAFGLLLGCDQLGGEGKDKSGKAGASCSTDGDCKNGFLCEAKTCVPESVAKKARGTGAGDKGTVDEPVKGGKQPAVTPPAATAPAATPVARTCGDPSQVPEIPSQRSNPPQGPEWDGACSINTQGANAQPSHCNMRIVREWLMLTCTGDVQGWEKMEDFGNEGQDYYKQFNPGQMGSFVVRLIRGHNQKVRICRSNDRASLFVSWPQGNDRPLHVALGSGPVCDGRDWGSGYKKK
jgi:hypothetical protein